MRSVYANTRRTPMGTDGATYSEFLSINEHDSPLLPEDRFSVVVRNVCGNLHAFKLTLFELEDLGSAIQAATARIRLASPVGCPSLD